MPPKGSGSQASTLVNRGGNTAAAAPRQTPGAVGATRRRSSALSSRPGYFYAEDSSLFELSPDQVMYFAIGFIVVVFILHIFGKLRGA